MRIVVLLLLIAVAGWAEGAFGTWKMNPARSAFNGEGRTKGLTLRIEPHGDSQVFTLHELCGDGPALTFSTILYLDAEPRDLLHARCSGNQSSRRVDNRTVEILRNCASGEWTRLIRRSPARPNELILDIQSNRTNRKAQDLTASGGNGCTSAHSGVPGLANTPNSDQCLQPATPTEEKEMVCIKS